jgi:Tfp pilus assembly protein PilV
MKKIKLKNNKFSKGFTLVETLVSISIFTVSILGLLSILSQGISDTGYAKQKMIAAYLAQEGIEYVRNMRDTYVLYDSVDAQTGWNKFINANKNYPSVTPNFTRTIQMTTLNSDEVTISSTVSWAQGSGNYNITFSENLFNWIE